MQPTQLTERIHILDILRGFGLFGIIFVNVPALLQLGSPESVANHQYYYFLQIFVESKFFTIFSFLFGVGFYLFMSRAKAKGENGFKRLVKRLAILLVFGIIHFMFHPGEALTVYAISGFILINTFKFPKQMNLILGFVLLAYFTWMTVKIMMPIPLILLGISAGQYGLMNDIKRHYKKWLAFTSVMGLIAASFVIYQYMHLPSLQYFTNLQTVSQLEVDRYFQLDKVAMYSAPFISAFYVGVLVLLSEVNVFKTLLKPLQYFGRMALTNYLAQTALMLIFSKLFFSNGSMTYIESGLFVLAINLFLIALSMVILRKFRYGPMEKLWRFGTYYNKNLPSFGR